MQLRAILAQLKHMYCETIGAEFAHVSDSEERLWLQDKYQDGRIQHRFNAEEKKKMLPEGFAYTLPTQAQWDSLAVGAERSWL
jgi:2-oxoglutarate dehydrogenase E1 component